MIVFLILSISVPVLLGAMEHGREDSAASEMEKEFGRLHDAISKAHYSGIGSERTITVTVPDGCAVEMGGEAGDAYSLRGSYNGSVIVTRYMERPAIMLMFDGTLESGKHTLIITSVTIDGKAAAEVREL